MSSQDIPLIYYQAFPRQGYFIPAFLIWFWLPIHGAESWKAALLSRN